MPPVLGPVSPSPTRLKSWAGSNGTTVSPSTTQNSDTSGPSRNDSSSTGCPASSRLAACARAASRSARHHDALARRKAVVLDHPCRIARRPARTGPTPRPAWRGCRRSRFSRCARRPRPSRPLRRTSTPRSRAASFVGPKHAIPAARTASATPSTSGTSGPITTRSAPIFRASPATASPAVTSTSCWSAIAAVPALPGAIARLSTSGSLRSAQQQRMFTGSGSDHENSHGCQP